MFRSRDTALSLITDDRKAAKPRNLERPQNLIQTKAPELNHWNSQYGHVTVTVLSLCLSPIVILKCFCFQAYRSISPLLSGLDQLNSTRLKFRPSPQSTTKNTAIISSWAHSPWRGWIGAWTVYGQELVCWQWEEHQSVAPSGWCLELMGQRRSNHLNSLLHYWSARIKVSFKQWYTAFKKLQSTAVFYLALIPTNSSLSSGTQQACPTATSPPISFPSLHTYIYILFFFSIALIFWKPRYLLIDIFISLIKHAE